MADAAAYPLVLVTWRDAYSDHDQSDPPEDDEGDDCQVETVGFLVLKGRKFLHVAHEVLQSGETRDVTKIPHGIVLSVVELKRTDGTAP